MSKENTNKMKESKVSNRKFCIIAGICILLVGAISFGITYYVRNQQMDEEFRKAFEGYDMERKEEEEKTISSYIVQYNNTEYTSLSDIENIVAGDAFAIHIKYSNGTEEDKTGYFKYDTDITEPKIEDGDYISIVYPKAKEEN